MRKSLAFISLLFLLVLPFGQVGANTCTQLNTTFYSDTSLTILGGGSPVETYMSPLWVSVPNAKWIWNSFYSTTPNVTEEVVFVKNFTTGNANISGSMAIAGDDFFEIKLNNNIVASEFGEGNFLAVKNFDLSPYLNQGSNTLQIKAVNAKYFYAGEGTSLNNPGGVIFSASIESQDCTTSGGGSGGGGGSSGGPVPVPPPPTSNPDSNNPNITLAGFVPGNEPALPTNLKSTVPSIETDLTESEGPESELVSEEELFDEAEEVEESIPLGALALDALANFEWYCFLVALAILLALYIISEMALKNNPVKHKVGFLFVGAILAGLVLFLFDYLCPLVYVVLFSIVFSLIIYFQNRKSKFA